MLRASVKILLLALLLAVLCSCGARSGMGEEGTSRVNEATGETTQNARPSTETTGPTTPDPARDEGSVDGPASRNTASRPAVGTNGMVSSAHPLATRAGLEILDDGGNAFDAAVAVSAALNVVEPMMSGVGGYGAIVVYDAGKGRRASSRSTAEPRSLDPIFRSAYPELPGEQVWGSGRRDARQPERLGRNVRRVWRP